LPDLPNLQDPKQAAARAATEEFVLRYFPGARRCGHGWSAFCPAHTDRRSRSLSVGVGANGQLLVNCFATCTFSEIIQAARLRGVDISKLTAPFEQSAAKMVALARRIWEETRPLAGTVAERYLRGRGINITARALRFHPHLASTEIREVQFPALVAGTQTRDGSFAGIQATWLAADGSEKAPFLTTPRKIFGHRAGGAVRLAPATDIVCLAEGLETGLSVRQATDLPVWITLGTSGLKSIELPPSVREVVIAADADAAGINAVRYARLRFVREGRRVRVVLPPVGKDFNEMVL
jgi:putative DNA primase/helicase